MYINLVLLSLITIRAAGVVIKKSREANSTQGLVSKYALATTSKPSTIHYKPTRRSVSALADDGKYLDEAAFVPLKYFQIQYAPLPGRFEKSAGVRPSTKIIAVNFASTETLPAGTLKETDLKTNIAPYYDVPRQSYRSFVPGYNIEVLQSVNRNSGHNDMYKNYPEILHRNKEYKITYMRENMETRKPEHLVTQTIPTLKPLTYPAPDKKNVFKPALMNIGVEQTLAKITRQKPLPLAKLHRIHLNLARVYSQGQGIPNLPLHDKDYSINIRRRKQNLLPLLYPEAFDKKSQVMGDEKESDLHFQT